MPSTRDSRVLPSLSLAGLLAALSQHRLPHRDLAEFSNPSVVLDCSICGPRLRIRLDPAQDSAQESRDTPMLPPPPPTCRPRVSSADKPEYTAGEPRHAPVRRLQGQHSPGQPLRLHGSHTPAPPPPAPVRAQPSPCRVQPACRAPFRTRSQLVPGRRRACSRPATTEWGRRWQVPPLNGT